jgi:hypothetical protein
MPKWESIPAELVCPILFTAFAVTAAALWTLVQFIRIGWDWLTTPGKPAKLVLLIHSGDHITISKVHPSQTGMGVAYDKFGCVVNLHPGGAVLAEFVRSRVPHSGWAAAELEMWKKKAPADDKKPEASGVGKGAGSACSRPGV